MNIACHTHRIASILGVASVLLLLSGCGADEDDELLPDQQSSSQAASVGTGISSSSSSLSNSSSLSTQQPSSSLSSRQSSSSSATNTTGGGTSSSSVRASSSSTMPAASSSSANNIRDTSAPSVPTLSQRELLSTSVTIAWTQAADNTGVEGYRIFRNGVQVAQVNKNTLSYTDSNLTADTAYSYTVSAGDAAKNWSVASKALNLKTLMVSGNIKVEWYIPSARENGDYLELRDIGGYEIRYKLLSASNYKSVVIKDGDADGYELGYLAGDYEFQIATFDTNGLYSNFVPIYPN